jgi:hypothetical protein
MVSCLRSFGLISVPDRLRKVQLDFDGLFNRLHVRFRQPANALLQAPLANGRELIRHCLVFLAPHRH